MTRTEDWADYLDPAEPDPDLPPEQGEGLDRVVAALRGEAVWSEPPAGLRATLLDAARRESAPSEPAPSEPAPSEPALSEPAPSQPAPPARTPLRRRPRRAWYVAAGVAAAAALVVALAWPRSQPPAGFTMAGTALAPRASAVAQLEPKSAGLAIILQIKGLAPAPAGTYYAAWLRGDGRIVPVGSFHWHKGGIPISLWSGVESDRYPELFVTLQQEGQPPTPSADVVLTGRVGPAR